MKRIVQAVLIVCLAGLSVPAAQAASRIGSGSEVKLLYYFEADNVPMITEKSKSDLKLVMGRGMMPAEFEKQITGMKVGDKKTITLTPEKGYGPHRPELLNRVPKDQLPPNLNLREGIMIGNPKTGQRPMRVAKILDDSIVLDQNHPLAGKKLVYHVQVEEIN
jgi:FKBP-type peptidyl-prolyl cis-trans isomerase 2